MNSLEIDKLNKRYPVPRAYKKQTQNDIRQFNRLYIIAVTNRIKALRHHCPMPARIGSLTLFGIFWVDVDTPQFPKHRLKHVKN